MFHVKLSLSECTVKLTSNLPLNYSASPQSEGLQNSNKFTPKVTYPSSYSLPIIKLHLRMGINVLCACK